MRDGDCLFLHQQAHIAVNTSTQDQSIESLKNGRFWSKARVVVNSPFSNSGATK